jgi:hypothetical protein
MKNVQAARHERGQMEHAFDSSAGRAAERHLGPNLFCVPRRSTRGRSRSRLLEQKFLKKVERSAARSQTAFFRMLAELNDLPEVTGAAEWRFRQQLKPLLLNQNQWGRPNDTGRGVH